MKQSNWKEQVESIKTEILRRGKESGASEILKQFSTRLSATILHFFSKSDSFSPESNLTVEQKAFMHSLQLYSLQSVMKLVVNYDVSKGLKVVIPGIEKSYRSLMVIPQLESFTKNTLESTALGVYKFRLEDALSSFLRCSREDLYEKNILAEKMTLVSSTPEDLRNNFFAERLRTLFSSNYRTYLMLKNRYFLNRLKLFGKKPKNSIKINNLLEGLDSSLRSKEKIFINKLEEKFDFREIEMLVKEEIFNNEERDRVLEDSNLLNSMENIKASNESDSQLGDSKKIILKTNSIFEKQFDKLEIENSIKQENFLEGIMSYDQLFSTYAEPLKEMSASFCPVPECSSPYFRPRAEDYRREFSNYFRQMHGGDLQVIVSIHNFILELLIQRGVEYNAAERWEMVTKSQYDEKSIYFRSMEKVKHLLDRKTEWSMLIKAQLPFKIQIPVEKGENIEIEKGRLCLFQIGTAFFDFGHQKNLEEFPDVFFKLMFGGHLLTSKNSVIHVEKDPYFTTTLDQMWHSRGVIYLFLMAVSHRFAIEFSSTLKNFLVKVLPKTLYVNGIFPSNS